MRFNFLDLEKMYNPANVIRSNEAINPNTQEFIDDGIYSHRIFGDLYGKTVEYTCNCTGPGRLTGQFMVGTICPTCNTAVKENKSIISNMGWIDLGEYKVFSPILFPILETFVGKGNLAKYTNFECTIDINGNPVYPECTDVDEPLPELVGRGVKSVCDNLDKILDAYKDIRTDYIAHYNLLKRNRSKILTSKLPVFSHRLRPAIFMGGELIFEKVNTIYVQLVTCNNSLQDLGADKSDLTVNEFINKIHELNCCVHSHVLSTISGKKGYIRNSLLGSRLNFSMRCVIVPTEPGRPMNEVDIPYLGSLEMFKLHIINKLVRIKSMTISEATCRWRNAFTVFDKLVYSIMCSFITESKGGIRCLLNRNPTIALGSMLAVTVGKIKSDMNDHTMSISNNVLSFLSGDYDGDTLNLFLLIDNDHKEHFDALNPKRLVISADTGMLAKEVILDKDYILGLSSLINK